MHRLIRLLITAAVLTYAHATAGTITVFETNAFADGVHGALFATYDHTDSLSSSRAIADVLGGHVGAFTSVLPGGLGTGIAFAEIGMTFQDMTPDDFLIVDLSLHGTFTPGSGAEADFFVDDGTTLTNAGTLTCNSYNVQFHGMPCYPGTSTQVIVSLYNVDMLTLTWQLQLGIAASSGTVDFYNSYDFSVTVPDGITIVNNPGGSLLVTPSASTSVPEPNAALLIAACLLAAVFAARRRRIDDRLSSSIQACPARPLP